MSMVGKSNGLVMFGLALLVFAAFALAALAGPAEAQKVMGGGYQGPNPDRYQHREYGHSLDGTEGADRFNTEGADAAAQLGAAQEAVEDLQNSLDEVFTSADLHSGPVSEEASSALGAQAATFGNDIQFGETEYGAGVRPTAHEMTHASLTTGRASQMGPGMAAAQGGTPQIGPGMAAAQGGAPQIGPGMAAVQGGASQAGSAAAAMLGDAPGSISLGQSAGVTGGLPAFEQAQAATHAAQSGVADWQGYVQEALGAGGLLQGAPLGDLPTMQQAAAADLSPGALLEIHQQLQQAQDMFSGLGQLQQSLHDTANAALANIANIAEGAPSQGLGGAGLLPAAAAAQHQLGELVSASAGGLDHAQLLQMDMTTQQYTQMLQTMHEIMESMHSASMNAIQNIR